MLKQLVFSALLVSVLPLANATGGSSDPEAHLFPGKRLFPVIFTDLHECQMMGGSYVISGKNHKPDLYSVVNLGFNLPVLAFNSKGSEWEFSFGTANFSQFDLVRKNDGTMLAGLMNSDFMLSGALSVKRGNNIMRLRLFHNSSHAGDDFVLRHDGEFLNDKSANYEQADITYLRNAGRGYFYLGAGYIYTIWAYRKRGSFQAGLMQEFGQGKTINYFMSGDLHLNGENDFNPELRLTGGLLIKRDNRPLLRICAEYYTGFVPYGTIDYGKIHWLGASMAFPLFN